MSTRTASRSGYSRLSVIPYRAAIKNPIAITVGNALTVIATPRPSREPNFIRRRTTINAKNVTDGRWTVIAIKPTSGAKVPPNTGFGFPPRLRYAGMARAKHNGSTRNASAVPKPSGVTRSRSVPATTPTEVARRGLDHNPTTTQLAEYRTKKADHQLRSTPSGPNNEGLCLIGALQVTLGSRPGQSVERISNWTGSFTPLLRILGKLWFRLR